MRMGFVPSWDAVKGRVRPWRVLASAVLGVVLCVSQACAEAPPSEGDGPRAEWEIGAMMRVSSPVYRGTSPEVVGIPVINCESAYAYIRGPRLGFKAVDTEWLECSLLVEYNGQSFDAGDSRDARMRALDDRRDGLLGGAEVRFVTPCGIVFASAAFDLTNKGSGFIGHFGYGTSVELGPVEIVPVVGVEWSDARFNRYYYGISGDEAAASGLAAYRSERSFAPYAGLLVSVEVAGGWYVFATGEILRSPSAVRRSPMVDRGVFYTWGLGVTWEF